MCPRGCISRNDSISSLYLWRHRRPGGPHVRCGRPWWLELSQHSGTLGPAGPAVELRGQYVDAEEHHGSHSAQWKVSSFLNKMKIHLFIEGLQLYSNTSEAEVTVKYTIKPPQTGSRHKESEKNGASKGIPAYVTNTVAESCSEKDRWKYNL